MTQRRLGTLPHLHGGDGMQQGLYAADVPAYPSMHAVALHMLHGPGGLHECDGAAGVERASTGRAAPRPPTTLMRTIHFPSSSPSLSSASPPTAGRACSSPAAAVLAGDSGCEAAGCGAGVSTDCRSFLRFDTGAVIAPAGIQVAPTLASVTLGPPGCAATEVWPGWPWLCADVVATPSDDGEATYRVDCYAGSSA